MNLLLIILLCWSTFGSFVAIVLSLAHGDFDNIPNNNKKYLLYLTFGPLVWIALSTQYIFCKFTNWIYEIDEE